ncbi:MAG: SRPBCC domain-containing protein, partial [Pseudorhodoplanes sp.]
RLELAGNLCRCTGYVGIVKAIQAALARLKDSPRPSLGARGVGPIGSHPPAVPSDRSRASSPAAPAAPIAAAGSESLDMVDWAAVEREGVELRQSFAVPFPRADVWRFFADLDQVVRCIPGARLTAAVQDGRAQGEVNVKLGPIVSTFQGVLGVARNDAEHRGVVRGAGRDARSPSSARAIIAYDVTAPDAATSRVDVSVKFLLSGTLAQFSRGGLVKDVADHLTRVFAQNLEAQLSGKPPADQSASALDAGAMARSAIWARIRNLVTRLMGRGA